MTTERRYFDADKLIRGIYHKIAVWHNNDERLNDVELGRELKFLSKEIATDVIKEVFGNEAIKLDREKLGMTPEEIEADDKEREERAESLKDKLNDALQKDDPETGT